MANTNKKSSAKKKLIPAAAMLACSAVMLSAATYAWFTMSREVEVKNIQMTATVPEDLQISLGALTNNGVVRDNTGFISGTTATDPTRLEEWSNSVDIANYYTLGRIIPASSYNGESIFFTPDADGVGKTVKATATYYTAADGLLAQNDSGAGTNSTYMTTLHAKTSTSDDWGQSGSQYVEAAGYNKTNDDGYYVDIPVWLRTSSNTDVNLGVSAYVINKSDAKTFNEADIELYKAARVVVIPAQDANAGSGTKGLINLMDGMTSGAKGWNSVTSVVDFYGASGSSQIPNGAAQAAGPVGGSYNGVESGAATNWNTLYKTAEMYTSTNAALKIPGSGGSDYGPAQKVWIRVWLEGEDPQCWNQNAGQDFSINLKFTNLSTTGTN